MRPAPRTTALVVALLFVLASGAAVWAGVGMYAAYRVPSDGPGRFVALDDAVRIHPSKWDYWLDQANFYRAIGQHEKAERLAYRAIDGYEACARCWMTVAESRFALGEDPSRELQRAISHGKSLDDVRARAAVLYSRQGDRDAAVGEFRAFLQGFLKDRDAAFSMVHGVFDDDVVLNEIVSEKDLGAYFGYVRRERSRELAWEVWNRYEGNGGVTPQARDQYVRQLLAEGQAARAWQAEFGDAVPALPFVVDSGFDRVTERARFGWRIADADGVRASVITERNKDANNKVLRLRFDGDHNVHFYGVSQVLPIEGGYHYVVRARVRSEELTSSEGPRIVVRGLVDKQGLSEACDLWVNGEPFLGTRTEWRETEVFFTAPSGCQGITIHIARPRSKALNKFIDGDLWVDDVTIEQLAPFEVSSMLAQPLAPFKDFAVQ